MIIRVSREVGQMPFGTFHAILVSPVDKPEIVVFARLELAITPVPETTVQKPPVAASADKVAEDEHTCWSSPAFTSGAVLEEFIVTSSAEGEQIPLLIVQRRTLAPFDKPETCVIGELA